MDKGDSLFGTGNLLDAKASFTKAWALNPNDSMPKARIMGINKILATKPPTLGLPPNLYVNLEFQDLNNNGILEAMESAEIRIRITNKGSGTAYNVRVAVTDSAADPAFIIKNPVEPIPLIDPGETAEVIVPLITKKEVLGMDRKLTISVKEHFKYDMEPAYLHLLLLL